MGQFCLEHPIMIACFAFLTTGGILAIIDAALTNYFKVKLAKAKEPKS